MDYFESKQSSWENRYLLLLNGGSLQIYPNKDEINNRTGCIQINPDITVTKLESKKDGDVRQILQLDLRRPGLAAHTYLLSSRYRSVQDAWFRVLTRFSGPPKAPPLRHAALEDPILHEGLLEKRGYWNPAWKPRHFVLAAGVLYYYPAGADAESSEPLGFLSVLGAGVARGAAAPGRFQFTVLVQVGAGLAATERRR